MTQQSQPHWGTCLRGVRPQRAGAAAVDSPEPFVVRVPAAAERRTDLVGLRLSDWLEDRMAVIRCSADHHSLAIAAAPHAAGDRALGAGAGLKSFGYEREQS